MNLVTKTSKPYEEVIDREVVEQLSHLNLLPGDDKIIKDRIKPYIYDAISFESISQQVRDIVCKESAIILKESRLQKIIVRAMYYFVHGYSKYYWFNSVCRDDKPFYTSDIDVLYGAYYSKAKVQIFIETDVSFEEPWVKETFGKISEVPICYFNKDINYADKMAVIVDHVSELNNVFTRLKELGYGANEVEVNGNYIPYRKFLGLDYETCEGFEITGEDADLVLAINKHIKNSAYCRVTVDFVEEFYKYVSSLLRFPEEVEDVDKDFAGLLECELKDKE